MDMHRHTTRPEREDRLSALRPSYGTAPAVTVPGTALRRWGLPAVFALLAAAGVALVLTIRNSGTSSDPALLTEPVPVAAPSDELLSGEALVAFPVRNGHFPPSLQRGDSVRVVATPGPDGSGETRLLPETVLVTAIDSAPDAPDDVVLTVRAPVDLMPFIAGAGSLHVARVEVVGAGS